MRKSLRKYGIRLLHSLAYGSAKPALPPSPKLAAHEIDRLATPFAEETQAARFLCLAGDKASEIEHYLRQCRRIVLLNALHLRARKSDVLLFSVLVEYDRLLSGAMRDSDPLIHAEEAIARAELDNSRSIGAGLLEALNPTLELSSLVKKARDFDQLLQEFGSYINKNFGELVLATNENFIEEAYLHANPDIAKSVEDGDLLSGWRHFRSHGQIEGRFLRLYEGKTEPYRLSNPLIFFRDVYSSTHVGEDVNVDRVPFQDLLDVATDKKPQLALIAEAVNLDASTSLDETNSVGRHFSRFQELAKQCSWQARHLYISSFRDASVDVTNGLMLHNDHEIWGDSAFATLLNYGSRRRHPDFLHLDGNFRRIIHGSPLRIRDSVMLAATWACPVNYGHWLTNTLLSIYLVYDYVVQGRIKLLFPPLSEALRNQLIGFGIPCEAIIEVDTQWVVCDQILYPSPLSTTTNVHPHPILISFFNFLREKFKADDRVQAPELVFVARGDFPSLRRMTNEDELFSQLTKLGFIRILPHELDLAGQIKAFSRARIIVGQFGAALWNIPFSPPTARLVEISTTNYVSNEYLFAAHLGGRRVCRVMTEVDHESHQNFEFAAPIEEIVALVKELMQNS